MIPKIDLKIKEDVKTRKRIDKLFNDVNKE